MVSLIQHWVSPVDTTPPSYAELSPLVGAGWTHLSAQFLLNQISPGVDYGWSGAFNIQPGEASAYWFNRYPQPASPFVANDPNQAYVTGATDRMFVTANNGGPGMQVTVNLYGDVAGGGAYCTYGTRLKSGFDLVYILTPGLIDAALVDLGQPYWAALFTAFWYTSLNVSVLCGSGPPVLPPPDLTTLTNSSATLLQYMYAMLWPYFCECQPGSPGPTSYPLPGGPQPTGWPTQPMFGCSNTDLCVALVQIQHQVAALQQALGENLELTTLLQRYGLPFAYIRGATHSGVTGQGSFAVSRLVGIQVHVTLHSGAVPDLMGNPPYVWNQGWISVMDGDGLIEEKRITQADFTWFPKLMPLGVTFGYSLYPGTVIDFTELEAEP